MFTSDERVARFLIRLNCAFCTLSGRDDSAKEANAKCIIKAGAIPRIKKLLLESPDDTVGVVKGNLSLLSERASL